MSLPWAPRSFVGTAGRVGVCYRYADGSRMRTRLPEDWSVIRKLRHAGKLSYASDKVREGMDERYSGSASIAECRVRKKKPPGSRPGAPHFRPLDLKLWGAPERSGFRDNHFQGPVQPQPWVLIARRARTMSPVAP
jgi:hypothetical protein